MRGSAAFRTGAAPGGALAPRWTQRRLWRAARATPSLDLNFADSKSLVDSVTGQSLVTFTRASNATYVDSTGTLQTAANDVSRFDHNPLTGESLGLLVEEARTNLAIASQNFADAAYLFTATSLSSSTEMAPDGSASAGLVLETATTAGHNIGRSSGTGTITSVTATTYTFSVFVKDAGRSFLQITANTGQVTNNPRANYNLSTDTLGTVDSSSTASITPYANGWKRLTFTVAAAGTSLRFVISTITSSTAVRFESFAGDTTKGFYIWGYSAEAGAFPTSYIPTTSAAATRSADVASISSFSSLVGCLFSQFNNPASGNRGIASVNDTSANNRIELRTSGTDPFLTVVNGGTTQADIDAGTVSANTVTRLSGRVTTDNFGASIAGGTEVLDTSGSVPTVGQLQIGRDQAGNYLNGRLARLAVWTQPLNTLQALTQ